MKHRAISSSTNVRHGTTAADSAGTGQRSAGLKSAIAAASLILLAPVAIAQAVATQAEADFRIDTSNAALTGLWWNANEPGWGISLTQQGPVVFVAWYTYDQSGKPVWMVMSSCAVTGNACSGDIFNVTGGSSLTVPWNPTGKLVSKIGSGTLSFSDTNSASFSYTVNGIGGSKALTRQVFASGATPPGADYSALWWNPAESGWGVALTQQSSTIFATVYSYDAGGNPLWYVASNCPLSGNACTGDLYQVTGGTPPNLSWNGANKVVSKVGTVNFAFADSATGTMSYSINGTSSSRSISRQQFYTPPAASGISLQQRTAAANSVAAGNANCTSLTPFYWEIGDANGPLASGSGGDKSSAAPNATTQMPVASASKWFYSAYAVEKKGGVLSAGDIKFLTFNSGYTNFDNCSATSSVAGCLTEPGAYGGTNGSYVAASDGRFYYNGGHMQVMAATSMGLGPDKNVPLTSEIKSVLGTDLALLYIQPQLPGGLLMTPSVYAQFLRNLLDGKYSHMAGQLGSNAVCTHTNSRDCPTAMYSPINQLVAGQPNIVSDEAWHYSLGHWVEDDPTVGDGAFSSPGKFGFYPWIDKSKTWYGVLARYDNRDGQPITDPTKMPGKASVDCGRLIRSAWVNGVAP